MNFLQIAQAIMDELDGTYPTTIYSSDKSLLSQEVRRTRNHINLAYTFVKLHLGMKNESAETSATINTVAGTEAYNIPTNILSVSQLKVASDPPINLLPWTEYERQKSNNLLVIVTGYPDMAAIYGRQIYFFPIPDSAYTITVRGLGTNTDLDLDADTPNLPTEFHRVIQEFALYYAMNYENNPRAGQLVVSEAGQMSGQGGQAAKAVNMFKAIKGNFRNHNTQPPRIIGTEEMRHLNYLRRVIKQQ